MYEKLTNCQSIDVVEEYIQAYIRQALCRSMKNKNCKLGQPSLKITGLMMNANTLKRNCIQLTHYVVEMSNILENVKNIKS